MRTKRRIRLIVAAFLAVVAGLVAAFEPNRIVPGLIHGEAFFNYRPTRCWREVLRKDGNAGQISPNTVEVFGQKPAAVGVLRECLKDPDPNVRWPAANRLSRTLYVNDAMPELLAALDDRELEVRLQILSGLHDKGPNAFVAISKITELLDDPEPLVALYADRALWRIHPRGAVEISKWKRFVNKEWQFSATFPPDVKSKISETQTPFGPVTLHHWTAMHGMTACTVGVSEYTEEHLKAVPPEEWVARLKQQEGPFGLKIIEDREINIEGLFGWQIVAESELGFLRKRLFWIGRRLYQVQVAFQPKFVNADAGEYFLNSFRITKAD